MNIRIYIIISAILYFAFVTSCSIERKLAQEFIDHKDSISVFLIPPDFVFKSNLKTWMIDDLDKMNSNDQNEILLDSSRFLKFINDTTFLIRYFGNMEASLRKYGIQVFQQDEIIDFMNTKNQAYQINLVQIEIEEDIYPYRAEEIFYDSILFYEDFNLDQVIISSWFEISKLNDTRAVNNILFASDFVTDELDGRFTSNIFTGEVKLKYNIYPMKTENIYTLAAQLGNLYAGYIFDYVMNQYIYLNFPDNKHPNSFLSYDLDAKALYPAEEKRFIFLEE